MPLTSRVLASGTMSRTKPRARRSVEPVKPNRTVIFKTVGLHEDTKDLLDRLRKHLNANYEGTYVNSEVVDWALRLLAEHVSLDG